MFETFETFETAGLVETIGWALVHSIWQGTLVALLYAAFAGLVAESSAQVRYLAACGALALMLALPAATALFLHRSESAAPARERAADFGFFSDEAGGGARAGARGESALSPLAPADAASTGTGMGRGLRAWAESRVVSLFPWMVGCWLLGVGLLGLRAWGGWLCLRRLRRSARPVAAELERAFSLLAARLRVSAPVRLCQSALVEVPTVVGHLRPVVLVPLSALVGLTPRQLEAVLAHELAHVRRYDFLVNLLQTAAETLLFFHPAVWWVSRRARSEREHAADDAAVEAVGDALLYARALATTEALRPPDATAAVLALAANGGSLMQRINRLTGQRQSRGSRPAFAALTLAAVALAGVMAMARAVLPVEAAPEPGATAAATGRQVAVTLVNFPGNFLDPGQLVPKTRHLIGRLAAHDIKAVAFVNEKRLYRGGPEPDAERLKLLRDWLDAGHELGNETYSHKSLYRASLAEWRADVERGEQLMSKLVAERGGRLRYFSYPYLNTGSDPAEKQAAEEYLRGRGYEIHPVTIDSMDWLFNRAYGEALRAGDAAGAARIRAEYVPYMERMFAFYEKYSREVVGREFPQVLMLTGGPLNADAIDELVTMMKRRGYSFVTMEEAMKDAAYRMADNYTGEHGDSWIARWAVSKGLPHRDTEEVNLPPAMQKYFEEFQRQMRAKAGTK
jgi:beta-lactamase regulating signal transducer with metallopeptidase domain/peptidoglycan/xylan/chitin deacetylase (PgdA/CDA1 family)